jgi:hypothetical protein
MKTARLLLATPILFLAACDDGGGPTGDDGPDDTVTYYRDVKPVVDAKCLGCHSADGIAPFALETYEDLADNGPAVQLNVEAGIMPPWPPNPDCNEYRADRSLSAEHKALITAWVEGGMLEGDPADEGAPIDVERVEMSRVDIEMAMERPYQTTATADYPDEYRCFVIPFPDTYTTTKYVTGFRAVPGNPKVVHHVIAFYAGPDVLDDYLALDAGEEGDGYTCFGGPGGPTRGEMLGGWAPGSLGSDFPAGTGLTIEPGSAVILQVHYNVVTADAEPDQSEVWLKIDDTVDKVATIQPWANPQWLQGSMPIPAGDEDVAHSFQFDASLVTGGPFTIHAVGTHQHQLGSRNKASILRGGAGGDEECLVQIDDWNFHWQGSYGLREPTVFNPGDQLRVECHWDNSPENQPIIDGEQRPPGDVNWGEGTGDEMCIAFFYAVPE